MIIRDRQHTFGSVQWKTSAETLCSFAHNKRVLKSLSWVCAHMTNHASRSWASTMREIMYQATEWFVTRKFALLPGDSEGYDLYSSECYRRHYSFSCSLPQHNTVLGSPQFWRRVRNWDTVFRLVIQIINAGSSHRHLGSSIVNLWTKLSCHIMEYASAC